MSAPAAVTVGALFDAQRVLRRFLSPSPLRASPWLASHTRARVLLKLESIQPTNAFKIRGAFNAIARLAAAGETRVVTASAGNHGRAMALAGERLGVRVVVFTPRSAPTTKKDAIAQHGAELRDDAPNYDEAERAAREYAVRENVVFISPYNHPDVIAGAGTVGLEILEQTAAFDRESPSQRGVDVVVVPLGGGGLASGVAIALKHASPHIKMVGVEVEASRAFATSIDRGTITEIDVQPSLADGLIGNLEPGSATFEYVRRHVDRLASVSEQQLSEAMRGLAAEEHLIAEGAGAVATAAVLGSGIVAAGQTAVVLVTGGNIDVERFREIL